MELVLEKYPETDLKTLVLKLNQKCRDKSKGRKNIRPIVSSELPIDGVTEGLSIFNESVIYFTCFVLQGIMMENK